MYSNQAIKLTSKKTQEQNPLGFPGETSLDQPRRDCSLRCVTYLELGTYAGGFLLLVQVQKGLCSPVVQSHAHYELQRFGIQQVLQKSFHNQQSASLSTKREIFCPKLVRMKPATEFHIQQRVIFHNYFYFGPKHFLRVKLFHCPVPKSVR